MDCAKMFRLFFAFMCCFQFIREISTGPVRYPSCQLTDKCVLLKNCKSYMVFINSLEKPLKSPVVQFLREKQCGFHDGYPKVCCPDSSTQNSATAPMPKNNVCQGENECTPLRSCKPYMDIVHTMEKPLKPDFVKFLRAQQCGFEDGYPMVCCSAPPKIFMISKPLKRESEDIFEPNNLSNIKFQNDEPSKDEPSKGELSKDEPIKHEPSKDQPSKGIPSKNVPSKHEPSKDEPSKDEPSKDEPSKGKPSIDVPSKDESRKDEPSRDEPSKDEPSKDELSSDEPSKDERSKDVPSKIETTTKSSRSDRKMKKIYEAINKRLQMEFISDLFGF